MADAQAQSATQDRTPPGTQEQTQPATLETLSAADIVVTAQKRNERLQDVPLTVSVVEADTLLRSNRTSFQDYLLKIPGVSIQSGAPGRSVISIRGVSSPNGNPLVGFTIDDVPFGGSTFLALGSDLRPDLDPAELDRIEVLQGPQGTLYGASSMGGLIKYVTRPLSLDQFGGHVEADVGSVSQGGTGYGLRGGVDLPLLPGRVAISVSGFYRRDAGFIDDPSQNERDINSNKVYGGRIKLAADLGGGWTASASALYQHNRGNGTARSAVDADLRPLYGDYEREFVPGTDGYDSTVQFYDFILSKDLGFATISALSGYTNISYRGVQDFTPQYGPYVPFLYPDAIEGETGFAFGEQSRLKKFSQELRLSSRDDGWLGYTVGLFYTHENAQLIQRLDPVIVQSGAPADLANALIATIPETYEEYAAFVNLDVKLAKKFDIQFGGRISHNEQHFSELDEGLLGGGAISDGSSSDTPFTFSISPRLRLGTSMLYARVSTGYRAGGPNATPPPGVPAQFRADTTTNYEIGLKSELIGGKLTTNLAAYYTAWKHIQVSVTDPDTGFAYYDNASSAKIKGVQADFNLRPVSGLTLSGAFAYSDAELSDNTAADASIYGREGDELPYVARWSGTADAEYRWRMQGSSAFIGGTVAYTGKRYTNFTAAPDIFRIQLPSFTTVDLRAGVEWSKFQITLFAKNIGNTRGAIGSDTLVDGSAYALTLITPRTIGLSGSMTF